MPSPRILSANRSAKSYVLAGRFFLPYYAVLPLFEKCDLVSIIESLRNEVVHNGTWELNPKVFIKFKDELPVERYMLFPDIAQGHLATVKSRNHFFGSGTKVNQAFPKIHSAYRKRLLIQ